MNQIFQEQLIGRLPIATQGMFPETITITITITHMYNTVSFFGGKTINYSINKTIFKYEAATLLSLYIQI